MPTRSTASSAAPARSRSRGVGATALSGANSYRRDHRQRRRLVNGDQTAATGATTVNNNARLGGKGVIGGDVTLTGNSTLSPGDNAPRTADDQRAIWRWAAARR